MKNDIYISSGALNCQDLAALLELCGRTGFSNVEMGAGIPYAVDIPRTLTERAGEFSFLLHNYFPPPEKPFVLNLGALDEQELQRSKKHCRNAIELSSRIGARFYSVHAGFAFRARPEQLNKEGADYDLVPMEDATAVLIQSLIELSGYAGEFDIDLLVENNVISAANLIGGSNRLGLGVTAEDLRSIVESVNSPRLGLLMDVGHLKVSGTSLGFDPESAIEELGGHIKAFHLSENNGISDQHIPFDEDAWFVPVVKKFGDTVKIIEAHGMEPAQAEKCVDVLSQRG